jgi:hypothetical protein
VKHKVRFLVMDLPHSDVISDEIARHPRCYDPAGFVFEPLHYLPLLERKVGALDQAAPLQGWEELPPDLISGQDQCHRPLIPARESSDSAGGFRREPLCDSVVWSSEAEATWGERSRSGTI